MAHVRRLFQILLGLRRIAFGLIDNSQPEIGIRIVSSLFQKLNRPGYGRGPGGEVWKLEDNLYPFVKLCAGVLSDKPLFVIINSYTTGLAPSVLGYLLHLLVAEKYGGRCTWDELGLPVTETGLALPCGATGRWFSE